MDGPAVAHRGSPLGGVAAEAGLALASPSALLPVARSSPPYGTAASAKRARVFIASRSRAWVSNFHQLTQDYLEQLAQLVEEYIYITPVGLARQGHNNHSNNAVDVKRLPARLRSQALGGNVQEDAALELDVGDLRRAERELLLQLHACQRPQPHTRRAEQQGIEKPASASSEASAAAPVAPAQRALSPSTVAVAHRDTASKCASHSSAHSSQTAQDMADGTASTPCRERESCTEFSASDAAPSAEEPPLPDGLLELFRQAQQLSSLPPLHSGTAEGSDDAPLKPRAAEVPQDKETEAAALARLCVKYFLASQQPPAPVTSPPSPPLSDRPSSPPTKEAKPSKDALHSHAAEALHQPQKQQQQRRREEKVSSSVIDTSLFPPPDLHLHDSKLQQQHQQQQQRSPHQGSTPQHQPHAHVSFAPEVSTTVESSISMSLNSPAAWRQLINKRTAAAASADHTPLPNVTPASTTRTSPTGTKPGLQGEVPPKRGKTSPYGVSSPQQTRITVSNAAGVSGALSKEKDDPLSCYPGGRLGLNESEHSLSRSTVENAPENTHRLPALHRRLSPPPAPVTTTAIAAPANTSSRPASSSPSHADQQGGPQHSLHRPPPAAHVNWVGGDSCHRAAATAHASAAAPRPPAKKERRHQSKGQCPLSVVLPPHYHGLHGEKLSTTELEQLVKSVTLENEEAQLSLSRTYYATDAAAEVLYALQQSVARVLLENVQLEKDIETLSQTSSTTRKDGGNKEIEDVEKTIDHSRRASSTPPAPPQLLARRALLALPVPVTSSNTAASFSNLLFTNASHGPQQQNSKSPANSLKTRAMAQGGTVAATAAALPDVVDRHYDPLAVLEELRTAASAREAEHAKILAEIDALSSRITRHDALLQAVAEYWRRNAAVMKRQQFAVQSQPKSMSSRVVTWEQAAAGLERRNHDFPPSSSSSRLSLSTSEPRHHSISSPMNRTDASATPPNQVTELEQALAHMEAVSPMLPSSAVSFDLHSSPSRTTENSSVTPTLPVLKRVTVQRRPHGGSDGDKDEKEELPKKCPHQRSLKQSRNQSRISSHPLPLSSSLRRPHEEPTGSSSSPSHDASSPMAVSTTAGAITRALFDLPESGSVSGSDEGEKQVSTLVMGNATAAPTLQASEEGKELRSGWAAQPPVAPPSLMAEPVAPRRESRTAQTFGNRLQRTSVIRLEGEEVLQVGSWRAISALQLEKVDEIAEFIYSVFERA
ncbi:hypothetical protein ABL78_6916 [Leptomonas seymouri]|uniref:Uncharacterized protein n=1 Tax=Leptomonas seymouri TaxID=5684 RepID=A0A0N1HUN9_LEPSE|nr:hypothetical protein ABL78_6916 [Leptomonas seymouri]|eukprot:KPI84032.1 hypothetical protein ABL78_6916 [Leptomonas seymouri]